ncbi:uncharacterized protein LOC122319463 [Drosophila yakuba]|uniref:uncharacterized protein LOC122319463 n=1 Tax=Drosophila yakuba TaxID=7245 RepID=UPI001C894054|nr:uncharacterized protein LOC122319463 [Drosophila yakuba]
MDGPAGGTAPDDVVDPFKRSAGMSRSPSKGVGITEITERAVIPVPGVISELAALNARAIQLQEAKAKEAPAKSTTTQTEAQPKPASAPAVSKRSAPTKPPQKKLLVSKDAILQTHKVNEPVPPSFASVAKEGNKNSEWTKVAPKRLLKKPEAIIIKKTGEASYTDMLRKLKADPCLSELGSHVKKVRRTQQGELLLEVEGKAAASMPEYSGAIEESLREMAAVCTGARRMALTCSGMDEATTAMELYSCMASQFEGILLNPEDVRGLRKMRDGTEVATVTLSVNDAIGVLNKGSVNVGWSRCPIIQGTRPIRCYKCLGYGHRALNCKEPDRSDCCLRCGEQGHKAKGCVNPPNCLICNSDTDRNHPTAAQSLLSQTAIERNADVMLLSEPYVPGVENAEALFDSTRKAAVICCRNLYIEDQESVPMRGIAYAKVKGVHLYSCYAPPSDSPDLFEDFLDNLIHNARGRKPAVIAGDFNAWAIEWGSRTSNPRGRAVIDAMNQLDLVLLNDGGKPTFNNDRGTSFIDVTFVNRSLASTANWMVQKDVTLSDHALITFSARSACITQRHARSTLGQAWDIRKLDKDMLAFSIEQMEQTTGHAESMVASLMKMLEAACDAAKARVLPVLLLSSLPSCWRISHAP